MRHQGWVILLVAIAAAACVASGVLLLSAEWTLSCTVDGQSLGGIDCFQANTVPQTISSPAGSIGFLPLVAACLVSATVLALVAAYALRKRLRAWRSQRRVEVNTR
jgi:hypothetical protein